MHRLKFLTFFLVFGIFISLSLDPVYSFEPDPEEEIIVMNLLASERSEVEVGTIIEVYIVIKNFSNFTMNNVVINQSLDTTNKLKFTESPVGFFNGTDRGYTDNVTVINHITGNNITLKSFNITSSNFTMNFDSIMPREAFSFKFKVNVTEVGSSEVPNTSLTYYDKFGDLQDPITSLNNIAIRADEVTVNPLIGFFPEIEVDDADNGLILIGTILVIVVAVLSRSLYKKKPIE